MTLTVPDHLWEELQAAEAANNAVAKRTKSTFSGGTCLTLEASSTSLRLLRAQIAVATAAKPSLVIEEAIMEINSWSKSDPHSTSAAVRDGVVEYLRGLK